MSLSDLIVSDVDDVFLDTDDFAATIVRYIGGDSGNITTFTGIVTVQKADVEDARGRGYSHDAELVLSSSVTINNGDAIKVGDERYEVKAVGEAEHGMRTVSLHRYQPEMRGAKQLKTGGL